MDWRNRKDWGKHIPEVSPEIRQQFQTRVDEGTCYVMLSPPAEKPKRLYGVENTDTPDPLQKEFWEAIEQFSKTGGLGESLHETLPVLLVRDPLNDASEPWNLPLCDLSIAGNEAVSKILEIKQERARQARLEEDFNALPRQLSVYSKKGQADAAYLLDNLRRIAEVAYNTKSVQVANIMPSAFDKLQEFWNKIEVLPINEDTARNVFVRVTKDDLVMKFRGETLTRVHKSLDGTSVSLGKMIVELALIKNSVLPGVTSWAMDYEIYGKNNGGLLHPHIKDIGEVCAADNTLTRGDVCTGSYESTIRDFQVRFDVVGILTLWQDFLTSCSEHGWYNDFLRWMPVDMQAQYCGCHRHKWSEGRRCGYCGQEKETA